MSPLVTGATRSGLIYNNKSSNGLINVTSAVTDPYFSNVKLLLHMDGINGSKTFTDSSNAARTVTTTYGPQNSSIRSKFGGASASFTPGSFTPHYLTVSSSDFSFGTGDFTFEAFIYIPSTVTNFSLFRAIFSYGGSQTLYAEGNTLWWAASSRQCIIAGVSTDTWYHFAVCRASGVVRIFLNGTMSATTFTDTTNIASDFVSIGSVNGGTNDNYSFKGNIDEVRITNVSRYSAPFTPPTAPFPNS